MKASVFIATSLDGFIARKDGALDWLPHGTDEPLGYDEFIATVDAIVIGRKTFEQVLTYKAWPYGTTPVTVLSTTPSAWNAPPGAICDFMTGDPPAIVERLRARGLTHLYVDGGITIHRFLDAGMIQRITITRIPVLLGEGLPLFGPLRHDIRLEHVGTRAFPSGMVQSTYVIAAPPAPAVDGP